MKHILFLLFLSSSLYYYWDNREVTHAPGVLVSEAPQQEPVREEKSIRYNQFTLQPKARISFKGRILSIKNYYFDSFSELTSTDIVFSWKEMSDERNLKSLMVRQDDRSFYWEMIRPPIVKNKMWQQSANMHLIAPGEEIREQVESLRKGHLVQLEGYLVDAESPKGWTIKTSLTRTDIGDGSSELLFIKNIQIL